MQCSVERDGISEAAAIELECQLIASLSSREDSTIQLANGGIYSAGQALKNGLIDEIVDPSSIEAWFADRGPVQIVEHRRRPTLRDALFGSEAKAPQDLSAVAAQLMASSTGPRFLYFWQGAR